MPHTLPPPSPNLKPTTPLDLLFEEHHTLPRVREAYGPWRTFLQACTHFERELVAIGERDQAEVIVTMHAFVEAVGFEHLRAIIQRAALDLEVAAPQVMKTTAPS